MAATKAVIRIGSTRPNPSYTAISPISSRYDTDRSLLASFKNDYTILRLALFVGVGAVVLSQQFLGSTDVEQPKGIEVVKEGIRKLRFSQQLRKAEGQRTPKVELTVSVDGVAIQEPKGKVSQPLSRRLPMSSRSLFSIVIIVAIADPPSISPAPHLLLRRRQGGEKVFQLHRQGIGLGKAHLLRLRQ